MEDAACAGMIPARGEPDPFFPEKGQATIVQTAQRICMTCPVILACREYRQETGSSYGVWAAQLVSR